jgi:mRNA interferase RelE/StbE
LKYELAFKPRARKDLKALPSKDLLRVLEKIENLADGLVGDVKRLTNYTPEYRLRVGNYRVLFQVEEKTFSFIVLFIAARLIVSCHYDRTTS